MNHRESPEERVRRKLTALRSTLFLRLGERKAKLVLYGIPVLLAVLIGLLVFSIFFPIRSFSITGDVTMFNESEIIEAAEIEEGDSLIFNTSGSIARRIRRNMPLCRSVKVRKTLTGKVKIEIYFSDVAYYAKVEDKYCALDRDLYVLDIDSSKGKYAAYGAVFVKLPAVREPEIGKQLVFYDTVEETDTEGETLYEVREERFYSYASAFLTSLEESGFLEDADGVDLQQRFDLCLVYAEKFLIRFGNDSDLNMKFKVLFGILEEGSMQYADKAVIDLTNPDQATARADDSLNLQAYLE